MFRSLAIRAHAASIASTGVIRSPHIIHHDRCRSRISSAFSTSAIKSYAGASATTLSPIQRVEKDLTYCREQVKLHDNDHYLCSLLLPPDARAGVHILRAFNLELAGVVNRHSMPTVGILQEQDLFNPEAKAAQLKAAELALTGPHEPTEQELNQVRAGLMKLEWWREGLTQALENVDKLQFKQQPATQADTLNAAHAQPVLNMLSIACKQYKLTNRWISRMIEAREKSLTQGQHRDINSLLAYAESTSSALLYLTLECLSIRNVHADHAASHIGKAMGIALTLRAIPYAAHKKQIMIPKTIVQDKHLDLATVIAGQNSPELSNCVFELASIAKSHVDHARQLMPQVPKEARVGLVSTVLLDSFLDRLEKQQFNLFHPELGLLPTAIKDKQGKEQQQIIQGGSLSGSNQGLQPLRLRIQLLKHKWKETY